MKIYQKIFFVLIVFFIFVSCSGKVNNNTRPELRYGFTTEPSTLDPLSPSNTADGRSILFNVFEGLLRIGTDGRLLPSLAESWTIEESGKIYTFFLREGVRFHDGSLLSSEDVKFTLETAAAAGFRGLNRIAKIETPGHNKIKLSLNERDPDLLYFLTVGIVKAGNTNREKDIIGTGPFLIDEYRVQQFLVLRKFDDYWQKDLPGLEKVTIVFLANTDALATALLSGSIDGARLTGSQIYQLPKNQFDIFQAFSASVQLMALNNTAVPFDDVRIRRAINYGIDIQGIIDAAFFGMGEPSGSPLIPGLSAWYEKSLKNPYPQDIVKARALLADAGYGTDGQKLSLEISVPSNYTMHVDTAQVIVNQLSAIGIEASIKLVDWATWLSVVYREKQYQATIISLDSRNTSPYSFLARYYSGASQNFLNFMNEDFDRVFDASLAETDEDKQTELLKEAQRIISDNAAGVFIQDITYSEVFRKGMYTGILNYPLYITDFASIRKKER